MLTEADGAVDAQLWVSLAEAGRRQTPPVSREAVRKRVERLVEAGRLTTKPGPRGAVLVNIVAYLRAVSEETDPAQALRNGTAPIAEPDGDDDEAPPGSPAYHQSRATREAYQAENARLDLEERLDRFVDKDDAARRTQMLFRKVRDRGLQLPVRVADKLAAAPDVRAIRAILTAEIKAMFTALSAEFETMDEDDGADDDASESEPGAD